VIRSSFSGLGKCRLRVLLAVLAPGLISTGLVSGAGDTTPPELKALRFSPASIDTSRNAAEVTIAFSAIDDASGVAYFEASFVDPSGTFRQSASAKFAPTLSLTTSAKTTFPRFSSSGSWTLSQVFLSDAAGNTSILDSASLSARGFPTKLEVISAKDTVSPKLAALEFTPSLIDTSLGPEEVKVNFTATDDLSGVSYVELSFVSPSGVSRQGRSVKLEDSPLSASNSITLTFPRRSEAGRWILTTVFLSDAANNTTVLNKAAIEALGFRTALDVISTQDTEPPSLVSLRFAPGSIDTSQGPAIVEVGFRATDDSSGVKSLEVVFESPSGVMKQRASAQFPSPNGISDTVKITFPRLSEPGEWTLSSVLLADAAGNTLTLDRSGLAGMGVPTTLHVRSAQDMVPPSLATVRFTPNTIDTRKGAAELQVEFKATDNYSGVKSVEVVLVSPSGLVKLRGTGEFPPSGELSGSVKVTFPTQSETGSWKLASMVLADAAGNTLVLDADALASRVGVLRVR